MRENPRRVQKDNGGPLQIKYKDTKINIDVIREQNVFYHWTQIILAPFFVTHNRFHLIDVTVAHIHKETWCWWGFVMLGEVAWLEERLLDAQWVCVTLGWVFSLLEILVTCVTWQPQQGKAQGRGPPAPRQHSTALKTSGIFCFMALVTSTCCGS